MSKGRQTEWDRDLFAEWLRVARARRLPRMSQRELAERLDVPQTMVSRWEVPGDENVNPPTLRELGVLVDLFGGDFLRLARMTDQWDDGIERRVLASALASERGLSHAPVAQRVVRLFPGGRPIDGRSATRKGDERPIPRPTLRRPA